MLKHLREQAKSGMASKLSRHRAGYATGGAVSGGSGSGGAKAYASGGMVDGGRAPGRAGFPKLGTASRMKPGTKKAAKPKGGTNVNVIVMPKETEGPKPMPPMPMAGPPGPPPMPPGPPMPPPGAGPGPMPPMRAHGGSVNQKDGERLERMNDRLGHMGTTGGATARARGGKVVTKSVKKREDGGSVSESSAARKRADSHTGDAILHGGQAGLTGVATGMARNIPGARGSLIRGAGSALTGLSGFLSGRSATKAEAENKEADRLEREGRKSGGAVKGKKC